MATPREQSVAELRRSIDVLPERTRKAMLIGLRNNTVIAGAFSGGGGVCPMMAAHRAGGRTSCVSFPEAWDRFTGVYGRQIIRPATENEMQTLRKEIEASFVAKVDTNSGLAQAISDHHATVEARRRRERNGAGAAVDLHGAIEEHRETARDRRRREADEVGLGWLFEDTLVLPDDFGAQPSTDERQAEPEFDFDAAEAELVR